MDTVLEEPRDVSEVPSDGIGGDLLGPSLVDELLDDLPSTVLVRELVEVGDPTGREEPQEDLERPLIRPKGVLGDIPMGTDLGSVDEELVHCLLQGDPTGEVDLVDEVLGVQVLLPSPTLLTVLGLQGGLNLPFRPIREGQDGLVVPPLPVLVDGTHRTPRIGYRWMGHLYRPYYIRATSGTRAA